MAKKRISGTVGYTRDKRGRIPSRQLFENGTYDLNEFHAAFLRCKDPTEYRVAIEACGSWKEWERLKNDWPTFKRHVQEWQDELAILLRSEAVAKIIQLTKGEDAKALSAAKFLSEKGWQKRSGAGRPSNAERKREAKELAKMSSETKEEESRILKVINGGV